MYRFPPTSFAEFSAPVKVLCGILPISQIPSIPACIHYALHLLPLEQILHLVHPSSPSDVIKDKRTWRGERPASQEAETAASAIWTTMDVLTAYADRRGWVTAKAGRPDANRAGNAGTYLYSPTTKNGKTDTTIFCPPPAVLRALAEGKIRWAFWPPHVPLLEEQRERCGIWLGDAVPEDSEDDGSDVQSGQETSEGTLEDDTWGEDVSQGEEGEHGEEREDTVGAGRFGALMLDEDAGDRGHSEDEADGVEIF